MTRRTGLPLIALIGAALLAAAAALPLPAQQGAPRGVVQPLGTQTDEQLEARTRAVASVLRCPVCQGESIQDSPSDIAREMRAVIRDQLAAGMSEAEVKAYFVERYGEWVLLAPPARGFNLLLYIVPGLALVGGGAAVAIMARRWTRRGVLFAEVEEE
jgi:cytochrome c-type biogenesis protein CcmH